MGSDHSSDEAEVRSICEEPTYDIMASCSRRYSHTSASFSEESDMDMDFGLFDFYSPPPPPPCDAVYALQPLGSPGSSSPLSFIPVMTLQSDLPAFSPVRSKATGFSFGSPHPAPPPPPLPPLDSAQRRERTLFAPASAQHVRAHSFTNSVEKQKSPEILKDFMQSQPLERGSFKLLRGTKLGASRGAAKPHDGWGTCYEPHLSASLVSVTSAHAARFSSSIQDSNYCDEPDLLGGSIFTEEHTKTSKAFFRSSPSHVVHSASMKRKKGQDGPHHLSPLHRAIESADPEVVEFRWTKIFKMQHSDGYWELTTELGEFINVDVDLFANVFLKTKGIHSLGVRACADILRLLATLLVLQLMRVEKLEEGKLLRTLFCLDDTTEPRPKWWGEVKRAVDWVCWADRQYPCVYSRLEFGLSWESSTRQLLGYEGLPPFSPLSGLNLRKTDVPLLVH